MKNVQNKKADKCIERHVDMPRLESRDGSHKIFSKRHQ